MTMVARIVRVLDLERLRPFAEIDHGCDGALGCIAIAAVDKASFDDRPISDRGDVTDVTGARGGTNVRLTSSRDGGEVRGREEDAAAAALELGIMMPHRTASRRQSRTIQESFLTRIRKRGSQRG